jgi:2-polyprenyl-3-methyl-5-hydroxy-6-metoxy-1,4-benzoquinol methylase
MSRFDYDCCVGDYQCHAIVAGPPMQSFWHRKRLEAALMDVTTEPDDRLLDVGCGAGVFTFGFADRVKHAIGADISRRAIAFCSACRNEIGQANCDFAIQSGTALALESESVDIVLLTEVIEHLLPDESSRVVKEIHRVLRPGGMLYLTTPNYRSLWPLVERILDAASLVPPLEDEQHVQRFTRKLLADHLEGSGFRLKRCGTLFALSPFVASISVRIADTIFDLERRSELLPGMLLTAVCTKEAAA